MMAKPAELNPPQTSLFQESFESTRPIYWYLPSLKKTMALSSVPVSRFLYSIGFPSGVFLPEIINVVHDHISPVMPAPASRSSNTNNLFINADYNFDKDNRFLFLL